MNDERKRDIAGWAAFGLLALTSAAQLLGGTFPYDFEVCWRGARDFVSGANPYAARDLSYVYPPASLYLFAPLGLLPIELAGIVWGALCWCSAAFAAGGWAARVGAPLTPGVAAAAALMFFPLYRALEPLNLGVVLLAALLFCAAPERAARKPLEFAGAVVAGFLFAIKPAWLSVALPMLLLRRRGWGIAGMLVGVTSMVTLSVLRRDDWTSFVAGARRAVKSQWTFDLWTVSPWLGALALAVWCALLLVVWRRGHEDAWLFALTAVVVWPRPVAYSYLVLLPLLFYLVPRMGKAGWGLAALLSTPLGYLLTLDVQGGALLVDMGHTWRSAVTSGVLWLCAIAITAILFHRFTTTPEPSPR